MMKVNEEVSRKQKVKKELKYAPKSRKTLNNLYISKKSFFESVKIFYSSFWSGSIQAPLIIISDKNVKQLQKHNPLRSNKFL